MCPVIGEFFAFSSSLPWNSGVYCAYLFHGIRIEEKDKLSRLLGFPPPPGNKFLEALKSHFPRFPRSSFINQNMKICVVYVSTFETINLWIALVRQTIDIQTGRFNLIKTIFAKYTSQYTSRTYVRLFSLTCYCEENFTDDHSARAFRRAFLRCIAACWHCDANSKRSWVEHRTRS